MLSLSGHELVFIFGLLGNIMWFMVFLAPLPTFYRIWKNKSSEGFQSMPYVVALLSAMLMLYYGFLKSNAILIVSINSSIGCAIEAAYLIVYLIYAPRKHRIWTVGMMNGGGFGGTLIICTVAVKEWEHRVHAVGWICAILNIAVFAAPLTIIYGFFTKLKTATSWCPMWWDSRLEWLSWLYTLYTSTPTTTTPTIQNAHEITHNLHDVV